MDPPPNTQYTVITHAAVRPAHRTDFVTMRDKAGRDFECVLPSALTASQDLEEASKTAEKEDAPEEEAAEIPPLDSFLAPLAGRCFLRNEGYWSFEVCHRKKVRQFHEEGKRASLEYSLGDFSRHESPPVTAENARTVVVKHWFAGGTPCDETVEPRQTVIEYRCGQGKENHIEKIREISTCSYVITFVSPLLCHHPLIAPASATRPKSKVADYLFGLQGTCFYRVEGWWTYEFCYQKHLKQFHQENNVNTAEFLLGMYDSSTGAEPSKEVQVDETYKDGSAYYAQNYVRGTKCDVTGEPRQVEVQFRCATDALNVISSIKERSTCKYVLVFYTPLICSHPSFQVKEDPMRNIECYPSSV